MARSNIGGSSTVPAQVENLQSGSFTSPAVAQISKSFIHLIFVIEEEYKLRYFYLCTLCRSFSRGGSTQSAKIKISQDTDFEPKSSDGILINYTLITFPLLSH